MTRKNAQRESVHPFRARWSHLPLPETEQEWLERARLQMDRFWPKVRRGAPDECWPWLAGKDKDGYGKFQVTGRGPAPGVPRPVQKHVRAHKLVWELENGPLARGLVIRHSCDNAACCNLAHLTSGTQAQNRSDSVRRGREPRGERKPNTRISDAAAYEIRVRAASGATYAELAAEYGVHRSVIGMIVRRTNFRHVGPFPESCQPEGIAP